MQLKPIQLDAPTVLMNSRNRYTLTVHIHHLEQDNADHDPQFRVWAGELLTRDTPCIWSYGGNGPTEQILSSKPVRCEAELLLSQW